MDHGVVAGAGVGNVGNTSGGVVEERCVGNDGVDDGVGGVAHVSRLVAYGGGEFVGSHLHGDVVGKEAGAISLWLGADLRGEVADPEFAPAVVGADGFAGNSRNHSLIHLSLTQNDGLGDPVFPD